MLSKLANMVKPQVDLRDPYRFLFMETVKRIGEDLFQLDCFEDRLMRAIESACQYLDEQMNAIPGWIGISEGTFFDSPVVPKLFGERLDIEKALGCSLEISNCLEGVSRENNDTAFALLGMRARRGQSLNSVAPGFADHTLTALSASENEARRNLRFVVFMRMVTNSIAAGGATPILRGMAMTSMKDLEKRMESVLAALANPDQVFRLVPGAFMVANRSPQEAPMDFPLLHCSDRRQWIVSFVRFSVAEAREALMKSKQPHRYILI